MIIKNMASVVRAMLCGCGAAWYGLTPPFIVRLRPVPFGFWSGQFLSLFGVDMFGLVFFAPLFDLFVFALSFDILFVLFVFFPLVLLFVFQFVFVGCCPLPCSILFIRSRSGLSSLEQVFRGQAKQAACMIYYSRKDAGTPKISPKAGNMVSCSAPPTAI